MSKATKLRRERLWKRIAREHRQADNRDKRLGPDSSRQRNLHRCGLGRAISEPRYVATKIGWAYIGHTLYYERYT